MGRRRLTKKEKELRQSKRDFLRCLEEAGGIVETACKNAGTPRTNVYRWRRQDKKFEDEWDTIRESAATLVESKLMQCIASNNITAIIYYLNNRGQSLGYNRPVAQEVNVSLKPIEDLSSWAADMDNAFLGSEHTQEVETEEAPADDSEEETTEE